VVDGGGWVAGSVATCKQQQVTAINSSLLELTHQCQQKACLYYITMQPALNFLSDRQFPKHGLQYIPYYHLSQLADTTSVHAASHNFDRAMF
jgi:hypothetical protein